MTVLQRTDLTTSQKIQCAAAAVAGQPLSANMTETLAPRGISVGRGGEDR